MDKTHSGWVTFAGVMLFVYGRVVAIVAASLSAIGALLSIPAYPYWSLAIFAIDIIIIHQVAVYGGREADTPRRERAA